MRIEALESIEVIAQSMSSESSECLKLVSLVDQFCYLKGILPRMQRDYILSLGLSGAILLAGGLSEQYLMMGVGGISLCFVANLRRQYLDAKVEYKHLQKEIKSKRIIFWEDHSNIDDYSKFC